VRNFTALSLVDPLRKINNLAAGQFMALFHRTKSGGAK
jgi:hypothetical protein